jgi:hypothetical protein
MTARSLALAVPFVSILVVAHAKVADGWEPLPPLPTARQEVGVAALEGKVYVIGGILADRSATGLVERFDVDKEAWEPVPPLPENARLHHIGAAAALGKVYAVGGLNASFRGVRSLFAFDPEAGSWERRADLPWPRGAMGVAALDGRIYAAGGQDGAATFADFAVYHVAEDRWEELPRMPTPRNHLAAAVSEGVFYAAGGRSAGLIGALEAFVPESGRWQALAPLPTPRAGIAAAVAGEELFVFGGEGNRASPSGIFPQVESYRFRTDRWYGRGEMELPRHGIGAAAVDGRIFIPGGSPIEGFGVTDAHDAFVPGTPPWVRLEPFRRGDSDVNGRVELTDAIVTLIFLFQGGVELRCPDAADADDNGVLEITDAIFTLGFLFFGSAFPPPPGPFDPGPDPTEDDLACPDYPL